MCIKKLQPTLNLVKIQNHNVFHTETFHYFFDLFSALLTKNINFSQKTSLFNNNYYYNLTRLA